MDLGHNKGEYKRRGPSKFMAERQVGVEITNGHVKGVLQYRDIKQLWRDILTVVRRIATIAGIVGGVVFGWQTRAQQNDLQNRINVLNERLDNCNSEREKQLKELFETYQRQQNSENNPPTVNKPAHQQLAQRYGSSDDLQK